MQDFTPVNKKKITTCLVAHRHHVQHSEHLVIRRSALCHILLAFSHQWNVHLLRLTSYPRERHLLKRQNEYERNASFLQFKNFVLESLSTSMCSARRKLFFLSNICKEKTCWERWLVLFVAWKKKWYVERQRPDQRPAHTAGDWNGFCIIKWRWEYFYFPSRSECYSIAVLVRWHSFTWVKRGTVKVRTRSTPARACTRALKRSLQKPCGNHKLHHASHIQEFLLNC